MQFIPSNLGDLRRRQLRRRAPRPPQHVRRRASHGQTSMPVGICQRHRSRRRHHGLSVVPSSVVSTIGNAGSQHPGDVGRCGNTTSTSGSAAYGQAVCPLVDPPRRTDPTTRRAGELDTLWASTSCADEWRSTSQCQKHTANSKSFRQRPTSGAQCRSRRTSWTNSRAISVGMSRATPSGRTPRAVCSAIRTGTHATTSRQSNAPTPGRHPIPQPRPQHHHRHPRHVRPPLPQPRKTLRRRARSPLHQREAAGNIPLSHRRILSPRRSIRESPLPLTNKTTGSVRRRRYGRGISSSTNDGTPRADRPARRSATGSCPTGTPICTTSP